MPCKRASTAKMIFSMLGLIWLTGASAVVIPSHMPQTRDLKVLDNDVSSGEFFYHLGNTSYFTPTKYPKATYETCGGATTTSFTPAAAFKIYSDVDADSMKALVGDYYAKDDVFTSDFVKSVFVYALDGNHAIRSDVLSYLASLGTKTLVTSDNVQVEGSMQDLDMVVLKATADCPEGPFVMTMNQTSASFYPTYKLEHDRFRTFVFGAYPLEDGSGDFMAFDRVTTEFGDPWIPLPSRLYSNGNATLTGERIAIKDIYNVQGLQTAAGSRAYAETYPVASNNSVPVQRLIDLGGVIVGKTKTAQFASGASTNDETLEVQYPFSARADEWQSCGASSSGSGCAMAAYDWLDYAIGSDTGGSVRVPAALSGLYGNRPTVGAISLDGVVPLGAAFDTAGAFSRDPYKWIKFVKAWYQNGGQNFQEYSSFPKKLIYPANYFPIGGEEGKAIQEKFLQSLESQFGMERVQVNVTEEITNAGFNITTINGASSVLNLWWQWIKVGKPLSDAYAAANEGRFPPLDTARRSNWPTARDTLNQSQYDDALPVIANFRDWFNNKFIPYDNETCAESIYVYDIGTGGLPAYREAVLNDGIHAIKPFNDTLGNPLGKTSVSPDAGCVDITIPLGQAAFQSNVTHITEYHPVTISLLTRAGCDYMLLNLVEALADAGLVTAVKTGRTPY